MREPIFSLEQMINGEMCGFPEGISSLDELGESSSRLLCDFFAGAIF